MPGTESGDWDGFRVRTLAQRLERGGAAEKRAIDEIAREKKSGPEARYLRWMQGNPALREKLLRWGTR